MITNPSKLERLLKNLNRVLWFTDLHMKPSNLERCAQLFDFIIDEMLDHVKPDGIIFTGDMHDGKDSISVKCQNLLISFAQRLEKYGKPLIVVPGNHDYEETLRAHHYEKDSVFPGHSLSMLDGFPNVGVIDDVYTYGDFAFIPYRGYNFKFLLDLQKIDKTVKYLFAHEGVFGANLGNGMIDDFSVPTSVFKGFDRVFMGHYHKFHQLENITYLGSPLTQSFGESNQTKYVGVIERAEGTLTLIPIEMSMHNTIEINADAKEDLSLVKIVPGYTRLIISGKKENINQVLKIIGKTQKLEDAKVIVKADNQRRNRMNISETLSERKMVEVYLANMTTDLDKDKLIKLATKFVESAKNAPV